MKRRDALKLLATSGLVVYGLEESVTLQSLSDVKFAHDNADVVLDQSGLFGRDRFVVGILIAANIQSELAALRKLRQQTRFACRLSYTSRNKFKASFATAAIDYWLTSSTMTIRAVAMEDTRGADSEPQAQSDSRYIEHVSPLLNAITRRGSVSRIVTQRRQTGPRGASLEARLVKAVPNIRQMVSISDDQSDLLQFLGFVTGSIYGAFSGTDKRPSNPTKLKLIAHLESKLSATRLWAPINHPKLVVRVLAKA